MGREIRRVPTDFDWPLEKVWPGFVNPFFDSDIMNNNASAAQLNAYDAWEQIPPPDGDGYQLWENVTEGSPVSPVFNTREALVAWMLDHNYSTWATDMVSAGKDWLPSAMAVPDGGIAGVTY